MEASTSPFGGRVEGEGDDTRVKRLLQHLQSVQDDASLPLDNNFLEECEIILPPQLGQKLGEVMQIVSLSARLLPSLQQDPNQLIKLLARLVRMVSFTEVISLDPPVDLIGGLHVRAGPFNDLILTVLQLATRTPTDAAHLANMHLVIYSLVNLWLATPSMATAEKAADVLIDLLRIDKEPSTVAVHGVGDDGGRSARGQGLMWRRVFGDKDIYGLLYSVPSFSSTTQDGDNSLSSKKEKSLAQARLLSAFPKIGAMDWAYTARSHHPEIEAMYGLDPSKDGLADFVLVHMTDWKDDVLIHMHLIQTYGEIISTIKTPSTTRHMSLSLEYLISRKLHERACSLWLTPDDPSHDPMDLNFLYGPSATYLSTYLDEYPESFLSSSLVAPVLQRLSKALDISANQWSHGTSPAHDLNVLASVPRAALLPQRLLGTGRRSSAFLQLPSRGTNVDALKALAHIIRGPNALVETFPAPVGATATSRYNSEAAAARALYFIYKAYHDSMFADLITHASTVALPEVALASMQVMAAVASARWAPLPTFSKFAEGELPTTLNHLPTEEQLANLLPAPAVEISETGIQALLEHGVREKFFPWLLKPPQSFAHLVGGRGDPESSAYRVAMAKWDLLQLVLARLKDHSAQNGGSENNTVNALNSRLAEGPWGVSQGAGSRIGTLEL
ncbi:hypothetical protein FH972_021734 [Carpinus fangiana]|uniref:Uncharacterized protein n=1 Tax=Carpinus fangiana TaxID=176857 RepID=A0A5N6KQS2_9ROSI|nr:hypothetical protein FH972_021734 [Carpinus fangiana]